MTSFYVHSLYSYGSFRKFGVSDFGVLILRILLLRVPYLGPLFSETPISTHCKVSFNSVKIELQAVCKTPESKIAVSPCKARYSFWSVLQLRPMSCVSRDRHTWAPNSKPEMNPCTEWVWPQTLQNSRL